jgi:spore coat protein U-like protein
MDARRALGIFARAACLCVALQPVPAIAGQATSAMRVSLTVKPTCAVEASPMSFDGRDGSAIDAESTIAMTCNTDVAANIVLDSGVNSAGAQRRLAGESGLVPYAIYADAGRQTEWNAASPVSVSTDRGSLQLVAYGRVEAASTGGMAGSFADTVLVTIDF